jgi:hypothetical protein
MEIEPIRGFSRVKKDVSFAKKKKTASGFRRLGFQVAPSRSYQSVEEE